MQESPDLVEAFINVTAEANAAFAADASKIDVIADDAGMTVEKTQAQMSGFEFPTLEEQSDVYFGEGGLALEMLSFMGDMFATDEAPALADYSSTIDTRFLD